MGIFGNPKIKHLRRLPDGNSIVLFWIALLAEARRCNSDGKIFLTESIPYTLDVLAEDFRFKESTVKVALDAFEQLDMIYTDNGFITITGWEDHQNAEGLARIREQNRIRQKKWYDKQKEQSNNTPSVIPNVRITQPNAAEEEIELEKESDKNINNISTDLQSVVDLYHSICISFPRIRSLSDGRKKTIKARMKSYSMDDFRTLFENAEASSFLKGADGGWKASFDWLIKESNMLKVLEGNYADKKGTGRKEKVPGWFQSYEAGKAELDANRKLMEMTLPDEDFTEEAEQLRKELQSLRI